MLDARQNPAFGAERRQKYETPRKYPEAMRQSRFQGEFVLANILEDASNRTAIAA